MDRGLFVLPVPVPGVPMTGVPTLGVLALGVPTLGVPTLGVPALGVPMPGVLTFVMCSDDSAHCHPPPGAGMLKA
jgi:hypothetical protein